jgi:hypothetical protein
MVDTLSVVFVALCAWFILLAAIFSTFCLYKYIKDLLGS